MCVTPAGKIGNCTCGMPKLLPHSAKKNTLLSPFCQSKPSRLIPPATYVPGRGIRSCELEIFLRLVRVDELARIHLPVRIPEALELGERLTQLRPKHFRIKKRARLPVPMLATDAPAVSDDQVPGLLDEAAELTHTLDAFQVEVDAHVDTAFAEVAVIPRLQPVAIK